MRRMPHGVGVLTTRRSLCISSDMACFKQQQLLKNHPKHQRMSSHSHYHRSALVQGPSRSPVPEQIMMGSYTCVTRCLINCCVSQACKMLHSLVVRTPSNETDLRWPYDGFWLFRAQSCISKLRLSWRYLAEQIVHGVASLLCYDRLLHPTVCFLSLTLELIQKYACHFSPQGLARSQDDLELAGAAISVFVHLLPELYIKPSHRFSGT
ncbi:hypothetical protein F5Y08DRAFT_322969 [Xylaria arbuscula]|nr:hypothetical protein F5Y08DRAFT_322969 [Xylaria arbuscula]